jgi:hypothetical protein
LAAKVPLSISVRLAEKKTVCLCLIVAYILSTKKGHKIRTELRDSTELQKKMEKCDFAMSPGRNRNGLDEKILVTPDHLIKSYPTSFQEMQFRVI